MIMTAAEHLWVRYLPGLLATAGSALLVTLFHARRGVSAAIIATLLGLFCMEAEYWVAHGFPASEVPFFTASVAITVIALWIGARGGVALGVLGLLFFAYVNIRYGAPYLLDYAMPVLYAHLLARSRRELGWQGSSELGSGRGECIWILLTNAITIWRTTNLDKWQWIRGEPW